MTASDRARIEELLDRWEEASERGELLEPADLCADSPELLDELTRKINALKAMDVHLVNEDPTLADPNRGQSAPSAACSTECSYDQLRLIAQGGLGIVYHAVDGQLHREVVLKFIKSHIAHNEEHRSTFRREAEITSRLDHPGIVPVYGMGENDKGQVFYVMRYIQGETLDAAIEQLHASPKPVSPAGLEMRNLLSRFATICKTIAYAHNRGIIHRDIKPANIMLGRYGETLLVDWGLATPVGRDDRFKQSGEQTLMPTGEKSSDAAAGTPAYMSPEATADNMLTPATDVYGLGATLYKLLTGKPAFQAAGLFEIREKVIRGVFPPPSELNPTTSKALEAICLKAMAREPKSRYSTALEMADDLEKYLADEPVTAFREPLGRRAARWARRHRNAAQAVLVGVAALALVTVVSAAWLGYLARSERDARREAEVARQQSLHMTGKFAARTVAGQIDLRWRILEAAANDATVQEALTVIDAAPDERTSWEPAQAWLNQQYIQLKKDTAIEFSSLFLLTSKGVQVARAPMGKSIGSSYRYRDYFHGLGRDLLEAEQQNVEPIQDVNLSATYASTTSGKLKVAFTVPLVVGNAAQSQVVGVLGMSVDLGEFGVFETDLDSRHSVVLVDSRFDAVDGEPSRGLILQHPKLNQSDPEQGSARVPGDALDKINSTEEPVLLENYEDPLSSGKWLASCEPVTIIGRLEPMARTGWIVLVQEQLEERE